MSLVPYRFLGVILLVMGTICAVIGLYFPIISATDHLKQITLAAKATILVPICLGLGVLYLVFGRNVEDVLGERDDATTIGWLTYAGLLIVGFVLHHAVMMFIESHGYVR